MDETLSAVFDGEALRPDSRPDLEPNTRYIITVRKAAASTAAATPDLHFKQAGFHALLAEAE